MAKVIETTQSRIINDVLLRDFQPRKVTVIDQAVIQDRTVQKFAKDVEDYALSKIPERFYSGVPDVHILYRLANMLIRHWLPHYTTNSVAYVPGTIARNIEAVGQMFSSAVKLLSLVKTKASINNAVDVVGSLSIDPMMISRTLPNINQDFVHLMLTDAAYRNNVLQRLTSLTIASPDTMDNEAIANLSGMIAIGRGEAIPSQYYPSHLALRSIVLALLRTMVDASVERPELIYDILPAYSLFILYVNVTENEQVYDTAFPAIAVAGANTVFHSKLNSSIKMMAVLFTKVGFVGKAFNGVLATRLLKEFFNLFPDLADTQLWSESPIGPDGRPIIDFSVKSFAQQNTVKFEQAVKTFDVVLPSMFAGYVEGVIEEFKTTTGIDVLLSAIADSILDEHHTPRSAFPNLTALFNSLQITLSDPEGVDAVPAHMTREVAVRTFQEFVLSWLFPTTESVFQLSLQVQQAYDRMLRDLGTPTGSLIPGINVELEVMGTKSVSSIPSMSTLSHPPYARLNETYAFPFFIPPLAIHSNGATGANRKFERRQSWTLSHLKFKYIRVPSFYSDFAQNAQIHRIQDAPGHLSLSTAPTNPSPFKKWSWPKIQLPVPSYMHDVGFAFTPLPFNYTFDTVYDSIAPKADAVEKLMTRTGKVPGIGYLTYGQIINGYMMNGTVQPADLALALAGLGFIYRWDGASWVMISPAVPTIYGMPTIIMMHVNRVNVGELVTTSPGGKLVLDDFSKPGADRVIFDRQSRVVSDGKIAVGTSVLVIHNKVPTPHRLRFFMSNVRNGFSLNVPYRTDFYASLMRSAMVSVSRNFNNNNLAVDEGGHHVSQPLQFARHFDLHQIFSEALTIMMLSPETGQGRDGNVSAQGFYAANMTGQPFEAFIKNNFETVLGFSNVIAPYPHLTMRDRYDELHERHLTQVFRPLLSRIYVDSQFMRSKETIRILALAPNEIESMDATDEWNFTENEIEKLSNVEIGIQQIKHSGKKNENVIVPEETTNVGGVGIANHPGQGSELGVGDLMKTGQEVPGAEVKQTVPKLMNLDAKPSDPDVELTSLSKDAEHGETKDVRKPTNKQKLVEKQKDVDLNVTRDEVDEEGTITVKNTLGEGVNLNETAASNKKKTGEGDPIDSSAEQEANRKKKPKGKKFSASEGDEDDGDDSNN